jgi:hypothetical protein
MGFHLWSWLLEDWNWTAVIAIGFLFGVLNFASNR